MTKKCVCGALITLVRVHYYGLVCEPKKTFPVTDRGGLQGCEMLRIPHYLDNRLIDGGKVFRSHTGGTLLPRNIFLMFPVLISVRGRVNRRA
jgi:hypothetical protein